MRTISAEQAELIDAARAAGIIPLTARVLEKDIVIVEALRAIAHIKLPGLTLTFSGGTCLSKAYGLLQRMSEDIDLRLSFDDRDGLTHSALRRSLRDLRVSLTEALRAAQFNVPDAAVKARNENKFVSFELEYDSRYSPEVAVRPGLRVEFMAIAPRRATATRTMRPLIDEVTKRTTASPVTLQCLAVEETYCEKIISYLRRAMEHLSDRTQSQYEERLARHIYDVHRIAAGQFAQPDASLPSALFEEILAAEADQYGNRDPAFRADPATALRETLLRIAEHRDFRKHYDRFAVDLLYGDDRPTFAEAHSVRSDLLHNRCSAFASADSARSALWQHRRQHKETRLGLGPREQPQGTRQSPPRYRGARKRQTVQSPLGPFALP